MAAELGLECTGSASLLQFQSELLCPPCTWLLQMPQYRPLLHHESADLLRCVHMKPDVAIVIVGEQQMAVYALGGSGVAPRGSVPRSS